MTEEPTPIFEELAFAPEWSHLWGEMARWNAEVTREPEPWGLTGPPSLLNIIDSLARQLPPEVVAATEESVKAEVALKRALDAADEVNEEVEDEHSEDRPADPAVVADGPAGSELVAEGHRGDPTDPG